jgi:NAD(P)-dependent dehydrogenase (short-subunit alcohol dehydrogenase family)
MALTILITGCSNTNGFGRLTSETLARNGHRVFAAMRDIHGRNAAAAESLRAFTHESGGSIHPVEIDVTSDASVEAGVAAVLAECGGKLDAVVNNAAVPTYGLSEGFTGAQVAQVFDTNVGGLQRVNRAVLPAMRARGQGVLVHIGSTLGRTVLPTMGLYCASKFAVEAIVEAFHYELAPLGVEAILVQPGAYPTSFVHGAVQPGDPARGKEYGPIADLPEKFGATFGAMMSGPNAPNPQLVADAVTRLIEMPAGERPLRTIVDAYPEGVQAINTTCEQVQAGMLGMMGMGGLLKVAKPSPAA